VAGSEKVIEIRQLFTLDEYREALELQQTIWGFADIDLLPLRFFVVANGVGGHVFGAFDGSRMIAFCLGIPGAKPDGRLYLHSHMLGVLPEYHNLGIGRRLKLRQREDALARGIQLIEWTFDPLALKNAFFNIERLGAIARRYSVNQYGITASPLHGGMPTDRCYAEWWIDSSRVRSILAGQHIAPSGLAERVAYPSDMDRIRTDDPARAREIQKTNGDRLQQAFQRGLAVTGFVRSETEGIYLLEPWA
jgi:predicted GNAT superfamily acetyltransferase